MHCHREPERLPPSLLKRPARRSEGTRIYASTNSSGIATSLRTVASWFVFGRATRVLRARPRFAAPAPRGRHGGRVESGGPRGLSRSLPARRRRQSLSPRLLLPGCLHLLAGGTAAVPRPALAPAPRPDRSPPRSARRALCRS